MQRRGRAAGGEWLRVDEVVSALHSRGFGASVSSVHRWTNQGCDGKLLDCRRVGKIKYIHRDALEAFISRDGTCPNAALSQQQFGAAMGLATPPKGGDGAHLASGDARRYEQVDAYLASNGLLQMLLAEAVPGSERSEVSEAPVTQRQHLSDAGAGSPGIRHLRRGEGEVFPYPVNVDVDAN